MPTRIQRKRSKGYRMPEGCVFVGRPTKWGNPWKLGEALARVPALDGSAWEPEGRIKAAGMDHNFHHPDGHVTVHHVRLMTLPEIVETYRREWEQHGRVRIHRGPTLADLDDLRGKDLACWCPLDQPCHADVLLEIGNKRRWLRTLSQIHAERKPLDLGEAS